MRHRNAFLTPALYTAMLIAPFALADQEPYCEDLPCVFVYQGFLGVPGNQPGSWAKEVEIEDIDNDGWPDIYQLQKQPVLGQFPEPAQNTDVLYINDRYINFTLDGSAADAFMLTPTSIAFPIKFDTIRGYDAEIVDLDLDGFVDIIRPDSRGILKVLWGARDSCGDGTPEPGIFPAISDLLAEIGGDPNATCDGDTGGNYDDVAVADFDADGDYDFMVAQYTDDICNAVNLVFENLQKERLPDGTVVDGTCRSFNLITELPSKGTHSVSIGDVDGDGLLDLLLANRSDGPANGLCVNQRRPHLYLGTSSPFVFEEPICLNDLDLVSGPTTVGDLVGGINDPRLPVGTPDLDSDGLADIVLTQGESAGDYGVYFSTADPPLQFTYGVNFGGIDFGCDDGEQCGLYDARYANLDLDIDGRMEMVFANINLGPGDATVRFSGTHIFRISGDPPAIASGFTEVTSEFLPPEIMTAHFGGIAVSLGDLDNDGDQDMVLGGVESETSPRGAAHVYENRTNGRLYNRIVAGGSHSFFAIDKFVADGGTVIASGTAVNFETSGCGTITLSDGFIAEEGSDFIAKPSGTCLPSI